MIVACLVEPLEWRVHSRLEMNAATKVESMFTTAIATRQGVPKLLRDNLRSLFKYVLFKMAFILPSKQLSQKCYDK